MSNVKLAQPKAESQASKADQSPKLRQSRLGRLATKLSSQAFLLRIRKVKKGSQATASLVKSNISVLADKRKGSITASPVRKKLFIYHLRID